MDAIKNLCSQCIMLEEGKLIKAGSTDEILNLYSNRALKDRQHFWIRDSSPEQPHFSNISIVLKGEQPALELIMTLTIKASSKSFKKSFLAVDISNGHGVVIMQAIPELTPFLNADSGEVQVVAVLKLNGLIPDKYFASFWMGPHNTETYDFVDKAVSFEVLHSPSIGRVFPHTLNHGSIVPDSQILEVRKS
jgi:hypothetical protein